MPPRPSSRSIEYLPARDDWKAMKMESGREGLAISGERYSIVERVRWAQATSPNRGVSSAIRHPSTVTMASASSFDVTTGVDLQEVDNAVNQAQKEIAQRYDFKGSRSRIEFSRAEAKLKLVADDDFRMRALFDVLHGRLVKRGVSVKNLDVGETQPAGGDTVRKEIGLKMALDSD